MKASKNEIRKHRKIRIRKKVNGTLEKPRLVVFRSNTHLYAQIVNDNDASTLVSASTLALSRNDSAIRGNSNGAQMLGKEIARLAKEKNIVKVVFDRNGYLYHGRIKAVADSAREGGLEF